MCTTQDLLFGCGGGVRSRVAPHGSYLGLTLITFQQNKMQLRAFLATEESNSQQLDKGRSE